MSCPTCDHTMQLAASADHAGMRVFWCDRCGTLCEVEEDGTRRDHTPKLVERCRAFEEMSGAPVAEWRRLGIAESIHPPGRRPR